MLTQDVAAEEIEQGERDAAVRAVLRACDLPHAHAPGNAESRRSWWTRRLNLAAGYYNDVIRARHPQIPGFPGVR